MTTRDELRASAGRVRSLASLVGRRAARLPAVRTTRAVLDTFGAAGGGLLAGGLAYATLVALLPTLLLLVSVAGLVIEDPTVRRDLVDAVAQAVPPLEDLARITLDQVASGAAPSSLIALVGLVWGSSRFYGALDDAFARIFRNAPVRNVVQRTARGLLVTFLFVAVPTLGILLTSVASVMMDAEPLGVPIGSAARLVLQLLSPISAALLFVGATAIAYRLVPARHVPVSLLRLPALVTGVILAAFTQLFTIIAPRLVGAAAFYGTFVAVFALLAWLAISYQVLLLGAAWTRVRVVARLGPDVVMPGEPQPVREEAPDRHGEPGTDDA
jgi:membrane protein